MNLKILRDDKELDFSVTRELVEFDSVTLEFKNNIAVISMSQFGSNTSAEFAEIVEKIIAWRPKGIVFDLRNNGGGLLNTAVNVLGYFLPENSIAAKSHYRDDLKNLNIDYRTTREPTLGNFKTTVLINKGSASASEIVAATLQDYDKATIVGEISYGKGTVQELSFFSDGTALKLTVAHWLSPNEQAIEGNGVTPDIEAVDDEDTENVDEALEQALRLF